MNIKELRKDMIKVDNTLTDLRESRELSLVKIKVQEAMMWCGSSLRFFDDSPSPYQNDGKRTSVEDIEKRFDDTDAKIIPTGTGHITEVDTLREYLGRKFDNLAAFTLEIQENAEDDRETYYILFHLNNILTKLKEARMWLGMELGRLKNN